MATRKVKKDLISIIAQCYNEEVVIPQYYAEMNKLMKKMDYVDFELIFINDASKDRSLEIIKDLAKKDKRVKYISMARNFGREACAMAGFAMSSGDYVTQMDIDLQDPPELLIEMYDALKNEGYDIAEARATSRHGYSKFHQFCINAFYTITAKISTIKMVNGQREYALCTRQVVDAILSDKEKKLFNKGIIIDVGFNKKWIEYENVERAAGETKFPYVRMIKYAVGGIMNYSSFPLTFILFFGGFTFVLFLIFFIIALIAKIRAGENIGAYLASFIPAGLATGVICMMLGIMSLYISLIVTEVKERPLYTIKETNIDVK